MSSVSARRRTSAILVAAALVATLFVAVDQGSAAHAAGPVNTPNASNNLAQSGSGRSLVTTYDHLGGGLATITDGNKTNTDDSCTWSSKSGLIDYWGIAFDQTYSFNQVKFTTGEMYADGGWFSGGVKVQVRQSGSWVDASSLTVSPTIPGTSNRFTTYTFGFATISGEAIRVIGNVPSSVGGYAYSFTSISEFEIYSLPTGSETTVINDEVVGVGNHEINYNRLADDNVPWAFDTDAKRLGGSYTGDISYLGDTHWSNVVNSTARIRFNGTSVELFGMKAPDGGKASVTIDGQSPTTIDYYASSFAGNVSLFSATGLSAGQHEMQVQVLGTKNGSSSDTKVSIDHVDVRGSIAASVIDVDDFTVGSGLNQFNYPPSTWGNFDDQESSYFGTNHASATTNEYVTFSFVGNQVELYGLVQPNGGIANIYIDNSLVGTADQRSGTLAGNVGVFRSAVLTQGSHELKVENSGTSSGGGHTIVVDRVAVMSAADPITSLSIDTATTHQTIRGFSASSGWTIDSIVGQWTTGKQEEVADLLYSTTDGIGLSSYRFYFGAGSDISDSGTVSGTQFLPFAPERQVEGFRDSASGPWDWDRQAGQQWMLQAAADRGVDNFIGFTHSAPFWLTDNGHTKMGSTTPSGNPCGAANTSAATNISSGNYDDYADYLGEVLEHFEDSEGITFDWISPINEPGWSWEGCGLKEEGMRATPTAITGIVDELDTELSSRGLATRIAGPEVEHINHFFGNGDGCTGPCAYLDIYDDATASSQLADIVTGHSYFTDDYELEALTARRALADELATRGLEYWQTEYCFLGDGRNPGRDTGITPALWGAKMINTDLTVLNATEWDWWLSVSNADFKDGLIYTDWQDSSDAQNIIESKMLWAMGNFSKFIRPGAERVELTGLESSTQVSGSSYVNTDGKVVTVLVNESQNARPVTISIPGGTATTVTPYVTSETESGLDAQAAVAIGGTFTIPPRSVVTLVSN